MLQWISWLVCWFLSQTKNIVTIFSFNRFFFGSFYFKLHTRLHCIFQMKRHLFSRRLTNKPESGCVPASTETPNRLQSKLMFASISVSVCGLFFFFCSCKLCNSVNGTYTATLKATQKRFCSRSQKQIFSLFKRFLFFFYPSACLTVC